MRLRRVLSWRWLGVATIFPLMLVAGVPSRAQEGVPNATPAPNAASTSGVAVAPSVAAAPTIPVKPGDNAGPSAAVSARWPVEDTPQHTVGRAPTPPANVITESEEPKTRGWSALLPNDSAPAGKAAAGAVAASKASHRASRTHVAKSKSPRATKTKSPRASVTHRSRRSVVAVARPRTSGHAKSSRAAHGGAKAHRPLALTPPALRTSRRTS